MARAQGPVDAAIRGRVTDHGVAASAVVQITPLGALPAVTEQAISTRSDGRFLLQRLAPGIYRLRAVAENGLLAETLVTVQAGDLIDVPLALQIGQATASQEQEAALDAAAELEPSRTEMLLQTLPVPDREAGSITQLDVSGQADLQAPANHADADPHDPDTDGGDEDGSEGNSGTAASYAGLAALHDTQTLDGLSTNQNFRPGPWGAARGGGGGGAVFGLGAVQAIRVMPHTFSVRYGGAAGGVLAVATRIEAAHLHGTMFVFERSSLLAAANPYSIETHFHDGDVSSSIVKPSGSLTQFGGSVGAPIAGRWLPALLRDRLGVFASLETQLHDDHIVSTPSAANFYVLSATQVALLSNRGVGQAATSAALNYLDSLSGETSRHAVRLQASARVDLRLSAQDDVTASYHGEHLDSPAGAALGQASDAVVARGTGSLGSRSVAVDAGTARWLHTFSSRWNSELRFQFAHDLEYETPGAPLAQEPAIGPGGYAPQVSITPNGFSYGTPASLGRIAYPDEQRLELAHETQLRLGSHLLTTGADWSRLHDRIVSITAADGAFSYDSGVTKGNDGGLVDWITDYTFNVHAYPNGGCPSINAATHYFCFRSYAQSFGPLQTEFVTHELAGFVEDSWRIRDGLTLTSGMRYDYTLLPLPQTPNYTLDADLAALALPIGGATQTFPEDRNNFGPRLGIAWGTKWLTAQVGYGWFYGRTPGETVRAALTDTALPSTSEHIRIRPTTVTACPQVANQGFGYPCAYTSAPPIAVDETTSATLFGSRFRTPTVQRASLSLERPLSHHAELRVSYAMALATQLPDSVDINIAPTSGLIHYVLQGGDSWPGLHTGETFAVPLYTQRLLPAYGPVTALVSDANATYHAATVEAHALVGGSLELRGSYTFSRSIDYGAQGSAAPLLNGRFDPFNHGYDKGLSSQQVPHRFAGTLVWDPQPPRGMPWLARAWMADWHLSALAVAGSGAPFSYLIFGGTYLSGGRETINGSGGATYLPTVGRNTLRLPVYGRVDVRLQREFTVRGRVHMSAQLQTFNLLNTQGVSRMETRAFLLGTPAATNLSVTPLVFQDAAALASEGLTTTQPFGTPLSSTNGFNHERQVELGFRARF